MVTLELIDTFIQFTLVFHFLFNSIQYVSIFLNDIIIPFLDVRHLLSLKNVFGDLYHLGITNFGPDLFLDFLAQIKIFKDAIQLVFNVINRIVYMLTLFDMVVKTIFFSSFIELFP